MLQEPYVKILAEKLQRSIDEALGDRTLSGDQLPNARVS
jgi:hypothetical protein